MNNKNWLVGGLLVAIVVMAVGYAALSQELNIFGTANVNAEWTVEITDIQETNSSNATTLNTNFTATTASFEVDLLAPSATATYDVTIKNNGTIDARVASIVVDESAFLYDVSYEVAGISVNAELAVDGTHTLTITVEWDSAATEIELGTETIEVTILYVQDTD